jgi:cobalamin synthase
MTVYLWHMTAGVAVLALFDAAGIIGSDTPATAGWWLAKVPFVAASIGVLTLIVPHLSRIERGALLAGRVDWTGSPTTLIAVAVVVSTALKGWTTGSMAVIVPALVAVLAASAWVEIRTRRPRQEPLPRSLR